MEGMYQAIPGAKSITDGAVTSSFRCERTGGIVTQAAHGTYYEAVKRGRVFVGSNAITGVAIPIYSAKANAMTLWNPAGNNYDFVLLAVYIGMVSTTNVCGNICLSYVPTPGAAAATAAPFPTATLATPVNALIGSGSASTALFSPAVNTTTDTPTIVRTLGFSTLAATATTALAPFTLIARIDGEIVLPPNSAIQILGATAVAMVATQAFVWEEVSV